jgi:hypothetical protein
MAHPVTPNEKAEQQELVELLDSANLHLTLAWRDQPDEWRVETAPALGSLTDELLELAKNTASDLHDNRAEITYDSDWPLNETQFFSLPNTQSGQPPKAAVGGDLLPQIDNFGQLGVYGASSRRRSNPHLYVIAAQLADGSIAKFGRRVTARHLLKKSRWIRAFWTGEAFDVLEEGPLLTLDPYIDWIAWRDFVFILDAPGFNRTFRTIPQLRQAVKGHVDAITSQIGIQNADGFVERCQMTPSMASKLESVVDQKLFEKPIVELKDYSDRYPQLGVKWDGDQLVFEGDLKHQWSILRLFDEAGFTGELSGEQFEAPAKRPL